MSRGVTSKLSEEEGSADYEPLPIDGTTATLWGTNSSASGLRVLCKDIELIKLCKNICAMGHVASDSTNFTPLFVDIATQSMEVK